MCGNTRSKLEKADILELTVNHLRKLIAAQRRNAQSRSSPSQDVQTSKPDNHPVYLPCSQQVQRLSAPSDSGIFGGQHSLIHQSIQIPSPPADKLPLSSIPHPMTQKLLLFPLQQTPKLPAAAYGMMPLMHTGPKSLLWRPW